VDRLGRFLRRLLSREAGPLIVAIVRGVASVLQIRLRLPEPISRAPTHVGRIADTERKGTTCSLNNASRSLKSGCTSMLLPAQDLDCLDSLLRRTAQPKGQVVPDGFLMKTLLADDLLDH
jgi:hypothetical protein